MSCSLLKRLYHVFLRVVLHIPKFGDASKSSAGDAASPAGDEVASQKCGIYDTAAKTRQTETDRFGISTSALRSRLF